MMKDVLFYDMQDIYSRREDWDRLNKKTILLTGAYGMLASYIVYFINYLNLKKDMEIRLIALVRNKSKFETKFGKLEALNFVKVIETDLLLPVEIDEEVDYIIHAASLASPQYYEVCPVEVLEPNTIGNYNLLKLAVAKKVKGYLLFSTGDVYGSVSKPRVTEIDYGTMDTLDIHNCYSESKRMAETMCKAFSVQHGVSAKIARIWHTYAPTMDIEHDPRVFSSFVKNIVANENIVMKSAGTGKRSFCYITDAIAGYFAILLDGESGEAYNVCNSSQYISIAELADTLVNLYPERHLKVVRKHRDSSEHYTENVLLLNADSVPLSEKLEGLGWKADIDVKEGFTRVIKYIESSMK